MPRIPGVRQTGLFDCGPASLASAMQYHGRKVPLHVIQNATELDAQGMTALGLVEAARRLGFDASGVRTDAPGLGTVPLPCIAHMEYPHRGRHFVTVYRVTERWVTIMEPADGKAHRIPAERFHRDWTGALILVSPRAGDDLRAAPPLVRFWRLIRNQRSLMIQAALGALACTILGLSTAIYLQKLIDSVVVDQNRSLLNAMTVVMLLLTLVQTYISTTKDLLLLRAGQRIDAVLILGYYRHLLWLPQRFFDTTRIGELLSRVADATKIRILINDTAISLLLNVMVVVLSLGFIFAYSWQLGFLTTALIPLYAAVYGVTNVINRSGQRQLMERSAEMGAQVVEALNVAGTIKRFGLEKETASRIDFRFTRQLRELYRSNRNALLTGSITDFLSRIIVIAFLWLSASLVTEGAMTAGTLVSCYALLSSLSGPMRSLVGMNRTIQDALIAADRLFQVMDTEREDVDKGLTLTRETAGDIRVDAVGFAYEPGRPVFDGLSFSIPQGSVVAIVGESGSGKSTMVALLHRLYPLGAGTITIGGQDTRHFSLASLRNLIGVVPQQIELFAGTVAENIAIGAGEPDLQRIQRITEDLGISDFIQRLPQGLQSPLVDNGKNLSGGQRQRLAIARALYRDPEILVLDEPTAALDSLSEARVHLALRTFRQNHRTVVLIAHRLTTVADADRVVVLGGGGVLEEGEPAALLQARGHYWRLWQAQMRDEQSGGPRLVEDVAS